MDFTALQAALAQYIGQNIDDVGSVMEDIIVGSGWVWRWTVPSNAAAFDIRDDRININCDDSHVILNYTVG